MKYKHLQRRSILFPTLTFSEIKMDNKVRFTGFKLHVGSSSFWNLSMIYFNPFQISNHAFTPITQLPYDGSKW